MSDDYFTGRHFIDDDLAEAPLATEYELCVFERCSMASVDLTNIRFLDCTFQGCDLSMAKIVNTAFRNVRFAECKILGLQFDNSNDFLLSLAFESCQLDLSTFQGLNPQQLSFKECSLIEVDFTEANLAGVSFEDCNLMRAIFSHSNLEGCDFRSAIHYTIDPEINRIRGAKFSTPEVLRLLDKYGIKID